MATNFQRRLEKSTKRTKSRTWACELGLQTLPIRRMFVCIPEWPYWISDPFYVDTLTYFALYATECPGRTISQKSPDSV